MNLSQKVKKAVSKLKARYPNGEFSYSTDWLGVTVIHLASGDSERIWYLGAILWSMWS
jgi:hypothetical protein